MADSTPTATPSDDTESCIFQRTVTLYDWWLIKAKSDFQRTRLAVGGVSSRKDEAKRVFVSAPVIKRHDEFSLETVDGKYVLIRGLINEQRTIENDFAPEVFNGFLFGFPENWESYALDCSRVESTTGTGALTDVVPASRPEILSDGAISGTENCIPPFLASPDKAQQKKQSACGLPLNNSNNENYTSVTALDNCDVVGQKSPKIPIRSQSRRQLSTSSEPIVKKSASRISRTLSPKTEGCYKKKVGRKRNKSASAVKSSRLKDQSHLTKGSQQKMSTASPDSLSFRTSRSGRLLLPPLEFWRNQIPIYNAEHELKEIQDGAFLISPCRVSSPSLSRFTNQKRAA